MLSANEEGRGRVDTEPIVTFLSAMIDIIRSICPQPPENQNWRFGYSGGVREI